MLERKCYKEYSVTLVLFQCKQKITSFDCILFFETKHTNVFSAVDDFAQLQRSVLEWTFNLDLMGLNSLYLSVKIVFNICVCVWKTFILDSVLYCVMYCCAYIYIYSSFKSNLFMFY